MKRNIGVLALQGDFREHILLLEAHGCKAIEVRAKSDLAKCSALIIPGGESTVMARLMASSGLDAEIRKRVLNGMPFYGTCAGAILAARKVAGENRYRPLGLIDIEIERNAYGRQVDSFEAELEIKGVGMVNGVFIRAPVVKKAGRDVEVLASFSGKPVFMRQGSVLAGTFHPETEGNFFAHRMLLGML